MRLKVDSATVAPLSLLLALSAVLAGCGPGDEARGCTAANRSLVEELSAATRSGVREPGAVDIDRVEVGRAVTIDLPEDLREYGADRLLATRASVHDADPPSPDFPGIEIDAFVAVSSSGELIAPLTKVTESTFDIEGPGDPSWRSWAEDAMASSEADTARSCVDPKA